MQNHKTKDVLSNYLNDISGQSKKKDYLISILDQSPIGIIVLDKACKVDYCNKTILEMFGYHDAEIVKQACFHTLFPISFQAKIQEICKELPDRNNNAEFDQICITKDGKEFLVTFKTVSVKDEIEGDSKLICYIVDASKQNQQIKHPENATQYIELIEDINDGIVIIQDQVIKYFNNTIARITGYEKENVLGRNFRLCRKATLDLIFTF